MKMGSAGLNNLILLDQVKGHCDECIDLWCMIQKQLVLTSYYTDPCIFCNVISYNLGVRYG